MVDPDDNFMKTKLELMSMQLADPNLGNFKGKGAIFKVYGKTHEERTVEANRMARTVWDGLHLHKERMHKTTFAVKRMMEKSHAGQEKRRHKMCLLRKKTRAEINLVCNYMLFKKGKFVPSRMV